MRSWAAALLLAGALVVAPTPAAAQQQQPQATPGDSLFASLFPPELIMQHRRAIGLTDAQRDAISDLIQDVQVKVMRLQWELLDEVESLNRILAAPRVDLDRSIDQVGRVLETEKDIKLAHLEMLVRIKNVLRPDQQAGPATTVHDSIGDDLARQQDRRVLQV